MGNGDYLLLTMIIAPALVFAQLPPMYKSENSPATIPTDKHLVRPASNTPKSTQKEKLEESTSETALIAIARADQFKIEGKLQMAAFEYRRAAELARNEPELKERALRELNYQIPIIIAQQQAIAGKHDNAKKILEAAAARNRQFPDRVQELTNMLNAFAFINNSGGSSFSPLDGSSVKGAVIRILKRYHRKSGHYPTNQGELATVLPSNKYPLIHFSIKNYRGDRFGFSLELQSKTVPENKIHIQQTGLLR